MSKEMSGRGQTLFKLLKEEERKTSAFEDINLKRI